MITFHGSELCSAPHVGIGTSYLSWIDLVERHRPCSSAGLLQQLAPLLRHRGFCTAMKTGQFALSNKSMYLTTAVKACQFPLSNMVLLSFAFPVCPSCPPCLSSVETEEDDVCFVSERESVVNTGGPNRRVQSYVGLLPCAVLILEPRVFDFLFDFRS